MINFIKLGRQGKGWGSSQVFLIAKTPGVYYKIITEASFVAVEDQQALPRDDLSISSWMSVLAEGACGFQVVLVEPR